MCVGSYAGVTYLRYPVLTILLCRFLSCWCPRKVSSPSISLAVYLWPFILWRRVFYWELSHSWIPDATSSGTWVAYFPYVTFASVVSFNDVTITSFSLRTLHVGSKIWILCSCGKNNISLTRSLRSLVNYCSCHSNIKFITSCHRVISSISTTVKANVVPV